MSTKQKPQSSPGRPPIVAVLGHVDHGKTSLLDFIRKTTVVTREHGGITQHIGAYQVEVKGKRITFIDTPGHEAFAKMRERGATVADIAILVVAADDSVKPQTIESIGQIKAANVPLIVAVNKIDLPTANIDKVKADLAKNGVQVEGFGGEVPIIPLSAKSGVGVDKLLEMISLMGEMNELASESTAPLSAVVVETKLDKRRGMTATVIVKTGTLKVGTTLFEQDAIVGKVRAMNDELGLQVAEAPPSKPVEIMGITTLPSVGSVLLDVAVLPKPKEALKATEPLGLPDFLKPVDEQQKQRLNIILKTDTAGSMEAIVAALGDKIDIVSRGVGEISEADILLAKSTKSFIVGFNTKAPVSVAKLAETEKVIFRTYTIIYELLDELADVVSGMKEVLTHEREIGTGKVIAEFPFEHQRIAGTKITSGRLARGDHVKLMRDGVEIARAKIKSLRRGKEDVTKLESPGECGILFDRTLDFALNDDIIAVTSV